MTYFITFIDLKSIKSNSISFLTSVFLTSPLLALAAAALAVLTYTQILDSDFIKTGLYISLNDHYIKFQRIFKKFPTNIKKNLIQFPYSSLFVSTFSFFYSPGFSKWVTQNTNQRNNAYLEVISNPVLHSDAHGARHDHRLHI